METAGRLLWDHWDLLLAGLASGSTWWAYRGEAQLLAQFRQARPVGGTETAAGGESSWAELRGPCAHRVLFS